MNLAERLANKHKKPLQASQLPEVKRLLDSGLNRKSITVVFGCTYEDLKRAEHYART